MITPSGYQKYVVENWSRRDAIKDSSFDKLESLAIMSIGLAGEAGEMIECMLDLQSSSPDIESFLLEAGDVLHYFTRLLAEFDCSLSDLAVGIYDFPLPTVPNVAMQFSVHVGKMLEHVKKYIRDGKQPGQEFIDEALLVLVNLSVILYANGLNLVDAAAANVKKLDERYGRKGK